MLPNNSAAARPAAATAPAITFTGSPSRSGNRSSCSTTKTSTACSLAPISASTTKPKEPPVAGPSEVAVTLATGVRVGVDALACRVQVLASAGVR